MLYGYSLPRPRRGRKCHPTGLLDVITASVLPDPLASEEQAIRYCHGDVPALDDEALALAHGRARLRWLLEADPQSRSWWKQREQRLAGELSRRLAAPNSEV